ncbi:MAG: hypothetical protein SRB1_02263 [Desulfobacteraceae bacterium Eth-SRB1]|nr:MAG: hypothetical protein SRB1_02263 [Desulfobacteraceae bacterium Eth-SRB1]
MTNLFDKILNSVNKFFMKRQIHDRLQDLVTDRTNNDVIIIEGARQVGKSHLVNSVLKTIDRPYLTYDLEKIRKYAVKFQRQKIF